MYRRFTIKLRGLILAVGLMLLTGCGSDKASFYADGDSIETVELASQEELCYQDMSTESSLTDTQNNENVLIPVYVCGAVCEAGVYYLPEGAIKSEALKAAGGFAEGAAVDYINLAELVASGEKIYFPLEAELKEGYNIVVSDEDTSDMKGLVNINTATKEELMTLPGIGESKAEAIITYRENNGLFQSVEDITNISGIKNGVYNNIKEYIVVN